MALRLVTLAGRPAISLDRAVVLVGRHPGCDAQLLSPRVSRWHCCLSEVDGELWVRDLASTNGVWINGKRVTLARLRPGDVLAIAHIRFQLAETEDSAAPTLDVDTAPAAVSLAASACAPTQEEAELPPLFGAGSASGTEIYGCRPQD